MIRVIIVEDMPLLRSALVALLSLEADIEVVAEVGCGDDLISSAVALETHASGFLLKETSATKLADTIRCIAQGEPVIDSDAAAEAIRIDAIRSAHEAGWI